MIAYFCKDCRMYKHRYKPMPLLLCRNSDFTTNGLCLNYKRVWWKFWVKEVR